MLNFDTSLINVRNERPLAIALTAILVVWSMAGAIARVAG